MSEQQLEAVAATSRAAVTVSNKAMPTDVNAGTKSQPVAELPVEAVGVPGHPINRSAASYTVRLDPETMKTVTEVVNRVTGEVLFSIPPSYKPNRPIPTAQSRSVARSQ